MTGRGRCRGGTAWLRVGAAPLLMAAASVQAQPDIPPEIPRERTGPEASPDMAPPFADPVEAPASAAVPAAPPAPVLQPVLADVSVREIQVASEAEDRLTPPPAGWTPPGDPAAGLRLEHEPEEALDSDWVDRQFELNLAPSGEMPLERALALVQLINRAYLTAGFVSSGVTVPEQTALDEGVLELRLVIGRLASPDSDSPGVVVEWVDGRSAGLGRSYVRNRFPSAADQPLSAFAIERDFRLLAQDPYIRRIDTELRPGERPGEAVLHVLVEPAERFDVYLSAANDRSPSVGGERAAIGGYVRSLFGSGDIISAELGTSEGGEDAQLAYAAPILTPRTTLSLRASRNDAAVVDRPLVPLDIRTRDRSYQAGLSHRVVAQPLAPGSEPGRWSPSRSLVLGLLLAHREQRSFLLGEPFSFAPGSVDGRTEYTAVRLTGDYLARNVRQVFGVALTATMGLGGTRSEDPDVPSPSRNFKSLLVQINYARRLTEAGLELRGRVAGQVADSILYSGERLSIGGESSVRGYRESLFLADQGVIASVELSQPFSLSGRGRSASGFDWGAFSASVFVDGAAFRNVDAPQPAVRSVAGAGVSLSWVPSEAVSARISYGLDLREVPIGGTRDIQDRGIHFRLVLRPLWLFRR